MASDFPYLYPYSRTEARHRKETQRHEDSFRLNVSCARAIEQAIREHFNEEGEKLDVECAQSVLEQYGFKRVSFVLTNSLKEFQKSECKHLVSEETYQWGQGIQIPADGKYNRYFVVDTAAALPEGFIRQTRDAYLALELFGPEHCVGSRDDQNYEGKVLVLSPAVLREGCWTPRNQLWLGQHGFGCSPTSSGRAVYATCLDDGEKTRWNRSDFMGVLDEQFLPDWAVEKLEELRSPQQEQSGGPTMGSMTIN